MENISGSVRKPEVSILLNPRQLSIRSYRHDKENPSSLSYNPVNAIYEDVYGTLWVGTVEGGLNRKNGTAKISPIIHVNTEG